MRLSDWTLKTFWRLRKSMSTYNIQHTKMPAERSCARWSTACFILYYSPWYIVSGYKAVRLTYILQNTAFSWCTRLLTRRIKWPVMLSVFKQPLQEKGSKLLIFNKSGKLRNWMGFFIAEITAMLALLCMTVLRSSGSLCHVWQCRLFSPLKWPSGTFAPGSFPALILVLCWVSCKTKNRWSAWIFVQLACPHPETLLFDLLM